MVVELAAGMELSTDVCVIGSGAGGAVLATELVLAGAKVVLLEAGGPAPLAKLGESVSRSFRRVLKRRVATVSVARGLPLQPIIHGRCEGGSTALNAGSAFRLPPFIRRQWERRGTVQLDPFFDRVQEFLKVSPTDDELLGTSGEIMLRGVQALGWSGGPVPRNAPGCAGRALCVLGCPEKAKRATHIAYLPVARQHGARVLLNTPAQRVLLRGRRAVGVDAIGQDGRPITIHADKTAVCGGAIFTPPLLERSGIQAPGLGDNLLIHPACVLAVHFDEPIARGPSVPQSVYSDEHLESEGAMLLLAEVPYHLSLPALLTTGVIRSAREFRSTGFWGALIRDDEARGDVRASWRGARRLRYRLGQPERGRLRRALIRLGELAFAAGAQAVTALILRSKRARSAHELSNSLPDPLPRRRLIGGSLHSMGTCGIGRTCDGDGRVRGYEDLYVADASLFPTSIGVNPQFTVMALATGVAASLLDCSL